MITIIHLKTSRSMRVIWLCEELGVPYKIETYEREEDFSPKAAFKALHPLGRSPMIRDGNALIIESGAIIEYVSMRHAGGKLTPKPESADYPAYLQWLHFAEGSAMTDVLLTIFLGIPCEGASAPHPRYAYAADRLEKDLAFANEALGKTQFIAGAAFTGADINMAFFFRTVRDFMQRDLSVFPNIAAYMARIEARPAYEKAHSVA
jgi:glutathione S-transferase